MDERFKRETIQAVHNPDLTRAIDRATRRQDDARKVSILELGDPWAVRLLAGRCRDYALDRLDEKLAQLTDRLSEHGVKVHWALDARQARRIVADIGKRAGCKLIIKTKSMMCEEIELNPHLQAKGFEVVETDLGEYIVQLAGEPPSHIIGPACHKSAKDIAKLFNEKLGVPYTEDAETLARSARGILREKFRQADMGITGANFAVAQTGSVVIVTNEGNGRFVNARPRVLVTVMGMEKVIDSTADLAVLLKVLARSATGQRLSVYTNLTTGPKLAGDVDGPQEYHVVIVDNGRSRVLASRYRQLLRCIRCGACLNACPVYRKIGGHAYGSIYPGPIGKLLTPLLEHLLSRADLPQASALCDACRDACAVRIELPEMLVLMRRDLLALGEMPLTQQVGFVAWAKVMSSPTLYRLASRMARLGLTIEAQDGWISRIPPAGSPWTEERDLPLPAERPFHRVWSETLEHQGAAPVVPKGSCAASVRPGAKSHHEDENRRPHLEPSTADPWREADEPAADAAAQDLECPRDVFLDRVRAALAAVKPDERRPDPSEARLQPTDADLVEKIRQRLEELKVVVHRASDADGLIEAIATAVGGIGARSAVSADESIFDPLKLQQRLSEAGCTLTVIREGAGLAPSFEADVGITGAEMGIAETGTVVLSSGGPRRRLLGLAPPAHIVILPTDAIVADLLDWAREVDARPRQACQTLITGPSKTADIELTLVTGMHAPGVVHVILTDQPA
ncbi:MAG: iron-sulfur cluster-binding protein [Phycisphaerae bacterium]|nr:iron-sulfur cluster-binding protein [Phycisphaerae bacterium]